MKQLFCFSILLLALLLPALTYAHDFKVDSIYYNRINDNEVEVTYGQIFDHRYQYHGAVTIPAAVTYDGTTYSVTSIGEGAFLRCPRLTSVVIPNSVTSIGDYAFEECPGLTSIVIPNSVTKIGRQAFAYCTGLTSIDIPNSVTAISSYAFYNTAWYDNQPDGLVYAGMVAYKYKGTMPSGTNMTLREGTLGIAVCAFMDCTGLTSIVIPKSVTEVGVLAFMDCPALTSIVVESGNPRYDSRNNCNAIIETASNTLIAGCKNTIIPNSVTEIGYGAFMDCTGLTSIVIPNSITKIGELAFQGCTGLTSVDIPNSVTEIVCDAFGDPAFLGCWGLTSIVVESGNPRYDSRNNCNAIIESASNTLIVGCKNTTIPNSVTKIGPCAFFGCDGLTSIDIPNSITSIGDNAFQYCTGLTSIVIPNSVTEIGDWAFADCTGLTDVYCYIADLSSVSTGNNRFELDNGDYSGRTLHVLQGTADAYRANKNWYPYFERIVEDIFMGDVNGDLEVNIADINAVIYIILSGNGSTTAADVNGDGEINIADINAVIDIILGRNAEPEPEHDWVDLGLPSGTLWATCNVGANSPEEFGHHFAWGETEPKDVYDWSTYKWCNGSDTTITKYCTNSEYGYNGFVDNKTELDLVDDAAYVNWGPSWCMPTFEQQQELYENCSSVWTTKNGVNGRLFTGPNGNTLFLPAAGGRWDGSLYYVGSYGYYWSRTLYTCFSYSVLAYNLDFTSGYVGCDGDNRIIGFTVRAVRGSQN